ncbi:hypothetical protein Tco_1305374, partial [Tanacetum coccineum]
MYKAATTVWICVLNWMDLHPPSISNLNGLYTWVDSLHMSHNKKAILEVICSVVLWSLWRFRNEMIFGTDQPKRSLLFDNIVDYSYRWYSSRCNLHSISWNNWIQNPLVVFSLFLLIAEALQISIVEACNKGIYKGIYLSEGGDNLCLLQYADDALFFSKWSRSNANNLILILKCFEEASGLKVNLSKSKLFGVGVNVEEVEYVASSLGCLHDSISFIYLGLPVGKRMNLCEGWSVVIQRLRDLLSAWKARSLSIGGRLTLIQATLGSIPLYCLSLFKAPIKIINALESIRARFFWGFKENSKGISWVKWNSILASRNVGGLGVGSLHAKNLGLLGKWKWRFLTKKDALWRKVIYGFCGSDGGFDSCRSSRSCQGIWCEIVKAISSIENLDPTFSSSFRLKVVNGSNTLFWKDRSLDPLTRFLELELGMAIPPRGRVMDDLSALKLSIRELTSFGNGSDRWIWDKECSGSFKVNTLAIGLQDILLAVFPSRSNLAGRGITLPSVACPFCDVDEEDLDHCLLKCPK